MCWRWFLPRTPGLNYLSLSVPAPPSESLLNRHPSQPASLVPGSVPTSLSVPGKTMMKCWHQNWQPTHHTRRNESGPSIKAPQFPSSNTLANARSLGSMASVVWFFHHPSPWKTGGGPGRATSYCHPIQPTTKCELSTATVTPSLIAFGRELVNMLKGSAAGAFWGCLLWYQVDLKYCWQHPQK